MLDDRGQAYTLEGFIGSILILTAVLFALQSVVITPTTGGTVDRDARDEVRVGANDMLTLSAESGNLSKLVRYWNGTDAQKRFAYSEGPTVGYSDELPPGDAPRGLLVLLNGTFQDKNGYNVIVAYQDENGSADGGSMTLVRNGFATESGTVATYAITLYDDQELTASSNTTLKQCDQDGNCNYPVPDAYPNSPVYNVVTVKVVVW